MDDASRAGSAVTVLTRKSALDLEELRAAGINSFEVVVNKVEVLLLDVKQVVAVDVVERLAAGDPARVDLEDGLWWLAVLGVELDVEGVAGYGHDLLLDDELGLLIRVGELAEAPDGRVNGLELTHGCDVVWCRISSTEGKVAVSRT